MEEDKRERVEFEDRPNTPGWILNYVYSEFPIEREVQDLAHGWEGFVFVHPDHDQSQLFVEKAAAKAAEGVKSVLLIPAAMSTIYWRDIVYPQATEVRILAVPFRKPSAKKPVNCQMALVIFAGRVPEEVGQQVPIFAVEPDGWKSYYKRARNLARFTAKQ